MGATMHNVLLVVVGAVVGVLARFVGPGQPPGPVLGSIFFGIVGAIGGQVVGRLTGFSRSDEAADFVTAIAGAVLLVVLYHAAVLRRAAR
jgi:uncharacterized membrane protein YeaQ/YmgE (transglycosylase-associated protein family)